MRIAYQSLFTSLVTCVLFGLSISCKKTYGPIVEIPELKLKEGQTVRTIMETVTEKGTMTIVGSDQAGIGELFMQRVRIFEQTKTKTGIRYDIQQNDSAANLRWKNQDTPSETKSELIGRPVDAVKEKGHWKLHLAEGSPSPTQQEEIDAFEAYANRGWLPLKPIKVGDSWAFDPKFISHIIHQDLANADATGVMTLKAIEEDKAAISIKIVGGGSSVDDKGSVSKAQVDLLGTVIYSLETGLEIGLNMKGYVTSGIQHSNGEIKAVKLPITITDRKKILD